jgi:hypothetical protein
MFIDGQLTITFVAPEERHVHGFEHDTPEGVRNR